MDEKEFELNIDELKDEAVEEMFDSLIESMKEKLNGQEEWVSVVNQDRVWQLLFTYKAMQTAVKGKDVKVTYELHKPFQSMGSVCVSGKDLTFDNYEKFSQATSLASVIDVYPKTNSTVQIDFTFHGLTKSIEQ